MVITVCDLIEKFECAGKFIMCGNNVTRKYWLIADRPNEAKKMWPFFAPCPDFMGGGGGGMAPLFLHPWGFKMSGSRLEMSEVEMSGVEMSDFLNFFQFQNAFTNGPAAYHPGSIFFK